MDISVNAKVHCTDGDAGHVTCVIINPVNDNITHLVAYDGDWLGIERIIPITLVASSTPTVVNLNCRRTDLQKYEPFIGVDYDFLEKEQPYVDAGSAYWPLVEPDDIGAYESAVAMAEHEQVPPGELSIRRGAPVFANGEQIGHVHEFVADPKTGHITHLVLTRGHLWGKNNVLIPLNVIDNFENDQVVLKIDKHAVGELPKFAIKR